MMKAYILGGLRSYVGVVNGMYRHIPAEKLGAAVLRQVMDKYNITEPDYIIAGNGVGAGGNIARLMALEAGVDCPVPAFTVDVQCGSGLESIAVAAAKLPARLTALSPEALRAARRSRAEAITLIIPITPATAGTAWRSSCRTCTAKR